MQGVFNPNILIYHQPNSAKGLHFSAFHFVRIYSVTIKLVNYTPTTLTFKGMAIVAQSVHQKLYKFSYDNIRIRVYTGLRMNTM